MRLSQRYAIKAPTVYHDSDDAGASECVPPAENSEQTQSEPPAPAQGIVLRSGYWSSRKSVGVEPRG